MSLAIFTHPHRPQETQILLGDQGIEDMFRSVFSAGKRRGAHDLYEQIYSRVPVLYHSYECRDIGDLIWNQCVISTPTSKMEYSGPHLFRDYVVSAAFGRFESGDIKGARDLFAKAVLNDWRIRQKSDQSWYALLKICDVERDYGAALEVAEMIVASCQNRRSSWIAMLCVYKKMNDVEVAIKRFKQAIDGQHFACLQALSMAYEHIGDNLNAIATLEKGIEVDPIEGYFYRKEIARIYEHRIQDYEKAVQTLQAQLTVSNTDLSRRQQYDVWCSLGFIYKKMEKFGDVIMAYEKSIDLVYNYYLLDTIVDAYIKNNDMDGAVERIKSEIIKSPEDNALQKTFGDLYMTIGNHDAAVEVFAAAIARNLGSSELEIFWNSLGDAKRSKEILEAQFTPMRWRYWRGDKKY
jgi:tetratricopeptide (TPR) repeat protein